MKKELAIKIDSRYIHLPMILFILYLIGDISAFNAVLILISGFFHSTIEFKKKNV